MVKRICGGCIVAMIAEARGRGGEIGLCAFCRVPPATSDADDVKRTKKLIDANNARAFYNFAGYYAQGIKGLPQDYEKANELCLRAGELGCAEAYFNWAIHIHMIMGGVWK